MIYKVIRARLNNDGTVELGKRLQTISWPCELRVGGLYYLENKRLYKVMEKVAEIDGQ